MKREIQIIKKEFLLILIIFIFSAFIRLFNIFEIGIFHWDSGYFIETALWLIGKGGMPYPWEPPLYSVFISLGFLFFGIHDWVAILISGIFGSLTILVTYLIAKEIFDIKTALISSLFLAINNIHILYSRMALIDSTFTFFFVLSFLFFLYSIKTEKIRLYIIYGIILGIIQNVKYNGFMAFMIPAIFLILYYLYIKYSRKRVKLNFYIAFKGMVIAFLIMIFMHVPWIFVLGIGDSIKESGFLSMESALDQIVSGDYISIFLKGTNIYTNIFLENKAELLFIFNDWFFYPYIILFISPSLLFCFIFSFAGKMKKENFFIFIWFMFFLIFFSFGYKATRVILPIMPAFSILSSIGVIRLSDIIKRNLIRRFNGEQILSFIIITVVLVSIPSVINAVSYTHNGYRKAGDFLKENVDKTQYIFTTSGPQIRFYYPDGAWWKFCDNVSYNKINYIVIDYIQYGYPDKYLQYIKIIQNNTKPLAKFYNEMSDIVIISQVKMKNRLNDDFNKIEIYKIKDDEKRYLSFLDEYRKEICIQL